MTKKPFIYVLSVDAEGGDGADYFPLREKQWKKDMAEVERMFPELLFSSWPPPKVEVIGLTKKEWAKAVRVGRERS